MHLQQWLSLSGTIVTTRASVVAWCNTSAPGGIGDVLAQAMSFRHVGPEIKAYTSRAFRASSTWVGRLLLVV